MNPNDRRRLLIILGVLAVFLAPFIIYPLQDEPAIPLGLDLSGGVDVQIGVDVPYTAVQELNDLKFRINSVLRSNNVAASLNQTRPGEDPGLHLTLRNPAADAT